eukprot:jgi/Tetstr1/458386/TSEL_044824.t1
MDAMELIGLPGTEVRVQSGKGRAITNAHAALPALSGLEVKKMLEARHLVIDAVILASHADGVKILACMGHCNMEIKEGFRKGSSHQPQRACSSPAR